MPMPVCPGLCLTACVCVPRVTGSALTASLYVYPWLVPRCLHSVYCYSLSVYVLRACASLPIYALCSQPVYVSLRYRTMPRRPAVSWSCCMSPSLSLCLTQVQNSAEAACCKLELLYVSLTVSVSHSGTEQRRGSLL